LKKIKVGIVNYLNTLPLLSGIERSGVMNEIELIKDYPSKIAGSLMDGSIDIGLVPVAIIPFLPSWYINTDYCIGADGAVASVGIFSDVPLEEAEFVLLDYQSRTSVQLATLLLREYFKVKAVPVAAEPGYQQLIKGKTAGVVIGDRALVQRRKSKYVYDLGEAWKLHTGLPFVFAAWISTRKLDPDFVQRFNDANREGLNDIEAIVKSTPFDGFDLQEYYSKYVKYDLTDERRIALDLFLSKISPLVTENK
jgi:chorismate dehydratase